MKYNGTMYYYILNLQGDVMHLVNTSGTIVASYTYDPWGKVEVSPSGSVVGNANPLRYRGYYYDAELEMYYLQSRYYDPSIGRFINADSYASTGQDFVGYNMFAYCGNNPISCFDSSGKFFNTICGTLVGSIVAVITRDKKNESWEEALVRGAVTGFIAGAALDVSIATAGTGAAILIAVAGGSVSAAIDYGWEQKNKGEEATLSGYVLNATIGGAMNLLFMGAGREISNAVGKTAATVGKAIWDNTVKSVTSRSGRVVTKKVLTELVYNTASSTIQGTFGKLFSFVFSLMIDGGQ